MTQTSSFQKISQFDLSEEIISAMNEAKNTSRTEIMGLLKDPMYGLEATRDLLGQVATPPTGDFLPYESKMKALVESDPDNLSLDNLTLVVQNATYGTMYYEPIGFDYDGEGLITYCSKRLIDCAYWNSGTNSVATMVEWSASSIRALLGGTFYNTLPSALRSAIVPVTKRTGLNGSYNVTTNEETIWLLSSTEVAGRSVYETSYGQRYTIGEGEQYPAFKEQFMRIKYGNTKSNATSSEYGPLNTASTWWLRSPSWGSGYYNAAFVNSAGIWGSGNTVGSLLFGVVPSFCI